MAEKLDFSKVFKTAEEVPSPVEGLIKGEIPPWLSGSFIRVGPGKFDFGADFTVNNFLDGLGIVSKFEFQDGGKKVVFASKYIQSDAYKKADVAGKPVLPEAHTCSSPDPTKSYLRRLLPSLVPEMSDNTSHNLFLIGNTLLTSNESYHMWSISLADLSTLKRYDTSKLLGLNQATAHPLKDPETGDIYSWGCAMSPTGGKYNVVRVPHEESSNNSSEGDQLLLSLMKKSKTLATIHPWSITLSSFLHTSGLSPNYLVLIEQPFFTNLTKVMKSVTFGKNFCCSDWVECPMDQVSNRFYIIEKSSGAVLGSKIEIFSKTPFIYSHIVNCFEDSGLLIIDVAVYPSKFIFSSEPYNLKSLRENGYFDIGGNGSTLQRFAVPLSPLTTTPTTKNSPENENILKNSNLAPGASAIRTGNKILLEPQIFPQKCCEFPVINPKFAAKRYSHVYGTGGIFKNCEYQNSVFKLSPQGEDGTVLTFKEENCIFGEPCFVPCPGGNEEDDGVIIVVGHSFTKNSPDFLLILGGKSFVEVGRVEFNVQLPPAMHGLFVQK